MIKLEITTSYYKRGEFWKESKKESKTFYDLSEAIKTFKIIDPKYYINKKDLSIIETVTLIHKIDIGYKRFYKTIDPMTEDIETNYKED